MIRFEKITREQYMRALYHYRRMEPGYAWGLSEEPEGEPYFFPPLGAYVCIAHISNGNFEVNGAFRLSESHWGGETAPAIVELCREIGAKHVRLDCFKPVCKVWEAAGFTVSRIVKFEVHNSPLAWRMQYGKPSIYYMEQELNERT